MIIYVRAVFVGDVVLVSLRVVSPCKLFFVVDVISK